MIAKQGWFVRRKYAGWGFTPATWQGWVYVAILMLPIVAISFIRVNPATIITITAIWTLFLILAFIDMAMSVKKDERETIHEAIADRNSLWAILATLVAGVAYQTSSGIVNNVVKVDPIILIALGVGVVVKAVSNIYLDRKN